MTDTTTMTKGPYSFRAPTPADAGRVAELVDAAYGHYVEQIGTVPGPMTADYSQVLRDARVTIAEREGVVGILTARIPGAELHVVPGADTFCSWTAPRSARPRSPSSSRAERNALA
jgi:hypothetical protein